MNTFRTTFDIPNSIIDLDYNTNIMLMGSCFSDNIGEKLKTLKFNVLTNPHGVLYNPYSIQESLRFALGDRILKDEDLVYSENLWHSYLHHSNFSVNEKDQLKQKIEAYRQKTINFLKSADVLFITFGTAWVYELKSSGEIVSNCHKVPAHEFKRFRLSTCDIVDEFSMLLNEIEEINPKLKIIFTLSPIRHLKDGAVENQLSKAILKVAIHELIEMHSQCSYFPSYEIVMDDLRDYRFYTKDMTHLSETAIDYIFNRFTQVFIPEKTRHLMTRVSKLNKALTHRPFNKQTAAHQTFIKKTIKQIEDINKEAPGQNWQKEIQGLKEQLKES